MLNGHKAQQDTKLWLYQKLARPRAWRLSYEELERHLDLSRSTFGEVGAYGFQALRWSYLEIPTAPMLKIIALDCFYTYLTRLFVNCICVKICEGM